MERQVTIHVEVGSGLKRQVQAVAKQEHIRVSDVVRRAIYAYLERRAKEKAA
jgi:predicted transcriptional regulator